MFYCSAAQDAKRIVGKLLDSPHKGRQAANLLKMTNPGYSVGPFVYVGFWPRVVLARSRPVAVVARCKKQTFNRDRRCSWLLESPRLRAAAPTAGSICRVALRFQIYRKLEHRGLLDRKRHPVSHPWKLYQPGLPCRDSGL